MGKGFTIKCNECGKETIYTIEPGEVRIKSNNSIISLIPDRDWNMSIMCDCGNDISEW